MNKFAELLDRLAYEPSRNNKLRLIADYLRTTPDPERGFALAALTGALSFQHAKAGMIRALIAERTDLEESWRLTSDSLALWLAGRIGADRCYLIKSIARDRSAVSAVQLARDGVVDAAFPDMLKDTGVQAFLLGRGDQRTFAAALGRRDLAGSCGAEID